MKSVKDIMFDYFQDSVDPAQMVECAKLIEEARSPSLKEVKGIESIIEKQVILNDYKTQGLSVRIRTALLPYLVKDERVEWDVKAVSEVVQGIKKIGMVKHWNLSKEWADDIAEAITKHFKTSKHI